MNKHLEKTYKIINFAQVHQIMECRPTLALRIQIVTIGIITLNLAAIVLTVYLQVVLGYLNIGTIPTIVSIVVIWEKMKALN